MRNFLAGVISMLPVLHWVFPHEAAVIRWISEKLDTGGVYCLTTYHPIIQHDGSDEVVLEAMRRIGGPHEYPQGFLPMGARTRPAACIRKMLEEKLAIESVSSRVATIRVAEGMEYVRYHVGTFGNYYSRLLPQEMRRAFLTGVEDVARESMRTKGYATQVDVCFWLCVRR
jgi:hypothetical protein